ncbi:MAG: hypothetical protein S0880_37875 [Actinomycetota bacterium]|nr:hypothetical protein [Actinomycetota bacterium]
MPATDRHGTQLPVATDVDRVAADLDALAADGAAYGHLGAYGIGELLASRVEAHRRGWEVLGVDRVGDGDAPAFYVTLHSGADGPGAGGDPSSNGQVGGGPDVVEDDDRPVAVGDFVRYRPTIGSASGGSDPGAPDAVGEVRAVMPNGILHVDEAYKSSRSDRYNRWPVEVPLDDVLGRVPRPSYWPNL